MKLIKELFPKSWFHWQNLNEFSDGSAGWPIEGRCWFNFDLNNSVCFEWNLKSNFCHIGFSLNNYDEKINFKVAFPPVALWFGIDFNRLNKYIDKYVLKEHYGKKIELAIHNGSVWWKIFAQSGYWDKSVPKWKDGNFNIIDFIFGKNKYMNKIIEEKKVDIPMPEGNYPATIKMELATWKRPRWFAKRIKRTNINMDKGIPFPGKGENSWDCGDDACYGMIAPANNIGEAIGKMVGSVLNDRLRRGGPYKWEKQK